MEHKVEVKGLRGSEVQNLELQIFLPRTEDRTRTKYSGTCFLFFSKKRTLFLELYTFYFTKQEVKKSET